MSALRGQYFGWLATVVLVSSGCAYTGEIKEPLSNLREAFRPIGATMNSKLYVVQNGDNLSYIAWRYQTTVQNLIVWNNLSDPNSLQPGQPLVVRGRAVSDTAVASSAPVEKVAPQTQVRPYQAQARLEAEPLQATAPRRLDESSASAVVIPPSSENTIVVMAAPSPVVEPEVVVDAVPAEKVVVSPASFKKPSSDRWVWPVDGRILRPFGGASSSQKGIDISSVPGQPVRAATGGIVAFSGSGVSVLGNAVIIDHDGDVVSAYTNVGELLVEEGEEVMAGDVIAYAAGASGGEKSKVHFEVRKQGRPLDPLSRLAKR